MVQELRRCGSMIETWPRTWIVSSASISKQFSTTFGSDEAHKYAQTLLLPKTSFPMRALASVREPLLRDRICDQAYRNQVRLQENFLAIIDTLFRRIVLLLLSGVCMMDLLMQTVTFTVVWKLPYLFYLLFTHDRCVLIALLDLPRPCPQQNFERYY